MSAEMYPVRLVDTDDLRRSRLTVFFRAILVIPHIIVMYVYGAIAFFAVVIAWFAALFTGSVPEGLHNFVAGYTRYSARVLSYMLILADPFPPFGAGGSYVVDLEIDPPVKQGRLGVFFRYFLALPCMIVAGILGTLGYLLAIACWFVALFTGGIPAGLRDIGLWCLNFQLRTNAYVMLVNPRYPSFDRVPGGGGGGTLPADQTALPPLP